MDFIGLATIAVLWITGIIATYAGQPSHGRRV